MTGTAAASAPNRRVGAPEGAVRRTGRKVAQSRSGDRFARFGLASRGVVFLVLGYLVGRVALGALAQVPNSASTNKPVSVLGVPQAVAIEPGGRAVLLVLAVGLAGYALFSALDTVLHHNDEQPAAKRWGDRLLSAWGAVMYAGLCVYAVVTALSSSGGSQTSQQDSRQKTQWSADVLRWPAGWLWLGALGAGLAAMAGFLVSRAVRRSFRPRLERSKMSPRMWRTAIVLGLVGYLGRAGLFAVVGGAIISAAVENDPRNGQGVNGAIRLFAQSSFGPYLLWVLAAMLIAYGAYMFVEMRYRRV